MTSRLVPARVQGRSSSPGRVRATDAAGLGIARAIGFVMPALVLIAVFLLFPALWTIYLGLTDYRLTGLAAIATEFVGLDNYRRALADPSFWDSLRITLIFVVVSGILGQTMLGFALAWALRGLRGTARGILETLVLTAWVIPGSVQAFLWLALLDRRSGTLNELLGTSGHAWLIENPLSMIILFNIWAGAAFSMQLFSSALTTIPPSQLEGARLAGAGTFAQLRDVVLPSLRGHILTNVLLITLWTFNSFGPYLLTAGGPNGRTSVLSVYIYQTAIPGGQLGMGAALSVIMLVINLVIAVVSISAGRARR
ncbi:MULTISPECIES: carbohydrate ABC transporter permease [unclassified Brachybacterium]|uniref:carbohydrate ABC transporter permease n=1 Tax=unclassified Brachybacterium TaxID=2623841 RepID=UPI000C80B4A4|nr:MULTISPECIES: sugar ABC transporter permease [unclassified Brachybacterium]PMC74578.1 ABC transporter permease [Brachybacterium sp. UMB0905]